MFDVLDFCAVPLSLIFTYESRKNSSQVTINNSVSHIFEPSLMRVRRVIVGFEHVFVLKSAVRLVYKASFVTGNVLHLRQ